MKVSGNTTKLTKIRTRIWEMEQAENLYQLSQYPPAGLHELKGKYAGLFAVNLTGNWRLIIRVYIARTMEWIMI
ncbi:hypothetical protein EFL50_07415 [Weissella cibaria]|nr:hypothetical protein [Weissella cibaria]